MHRTFVLVALISFVFAAGPQKAQAGILSKLFGELFSSSASKSASEVGQAAVRNVDEAVPAPKSQAEDPALEAGQFMVEEAVGNAIKDGLSTPSDDERYLRDPY